MEPEIRPARASDREPLMSFIKHVWGGHDYVPYIWDHWLNDPSGRMFVAEVSGVPVGMNRVAFLEDGSAWFEGVRVHPDYRGQGVATKLGEKAVQTAEEKGVRVFRLTSGSTNKTAHRQIARMRFGEVSRFSVYRPPKGGRPSRRKGAEKATARDSDRVIELIQRCAEYRIGKGVFWHNYRAAALTQGVVRMLVKEGSVWLSGEAIVITREGGEGRGAWEEYCFVGGPPEDALKVLDSVMGWLKGAAVRWVFVPQGSALIHALRARGFKRDFALVVFERLAKG